MEIIDTLLGLAQHISIRHVLVLNLWGWTIKCLLNHKGWGNWTDIVPPILGVSGITLAALDLDTTQGHFIVYGLANAGAAWLLHRIVKPIPGLIKQMGKK
jgi:hypothetical protein